MRRKGISPIVSRRMIAQASQAFLEASDATADSVSKHGQFLLLGQENLLALHRAQELSMHIHWYVVHREVALHSSEGLAHIL